MRTVLHILTRPDDSPAAVVIAKQQMLSELEVKVADLTAPNLDYRKLLDEIFAADAVAVW